MQRRSIRAAILGIAAAAAAFTAAAATVSSPYRPTVSPISAARLADPGQEALDLDRAALAALRSAEGELRIPGFPVAPGALETLAVRRFEVATPDARVTVSGPDGEQSLPFPSIAHFGGKIDGDPDSSVYLAVHGDALYAYIRASGARQAYVGPIGSGADFVARTADSPLNELALEPWT